MKNNFFKNQILKNKISSNSFRFVKFVAPIFLLIIFAIFACNFGVKTISIFSVVLKKCSALDAAVMTKIRLPRIVICIFCGALLGGTGAVFQGFFRNPLADASILGVSSGATFGAVLSTFFSSAVFGVINFVISPITIFAFCGAIFSSIIVFGFSKIFRENSSVALLLSGTAVGTFFSAITSVLLLTQREKMQSIYAWTLGSFNAKSWNDFFVFALPAIVAFFLLELCARHLDVLVCGEKSAVALGLDYKKVQVLVLVAGSLASSCAVVAGGTIAFVGLIAPHIARKIFGPRHKILIFESMIFGAILTLVSDTICRTVIAPSELPVGVITSLIGAPFFIYSLTKMGSH